MFHGSINLSYPREKTCKTEELLTSWAFIAEGNKCFDTLNECKKCLDTI